MIALVTASAEGWAHPHVLVVTSFTFVFDEEGLKEIASTWQYDSITSTDLFAIHDTNTDGELSQDELDRMAKELCGNVRQHKHFTSLKIDGLGKSVRAVSSAEAAEERYRLLLSFVIPCRVAASERTREIRIAQYDPSYYVAFEFGAPEYTVVGAEPFDYSVSRRTDSGKSFYGGTLHPEELVLRFRNKDSEIVGQDDGLLLQPDTNQSLTVEEAPSGPTPNAAPARTSLMAWLTAKQFALRQRLEDLLSERDGQSPRPSTVLWLCLVAFGYGALHAAGPGHGKAVTASYMVGEEQRLSSGIALGSLFALFHSLSGVVVVLVGRFVLERTAMVSMAGASRPLRVISFGMIAILGAVMLTRELIGWLRNRGTVHEGSQDSAPHPGSAKRHILLLALAAGLVPCPAVVLIMLFCSGTGHLLMGILLAACVTLGMAVTISLVGILVTTVKQRALSRLQAAPWRMARIQGAFHVAAWGLILMFGLALMFLSLAEA